MISRRFFSSLVKPKFKVAVIGAGGGIGQPLSLLLKTSPLIKDLNLFDLVGTPGIAADVSHCDTIAKVRGYMGNNDLDAALDKCDVVIVPAGVPRKPGMTRDDLFNINAGIVQNLAKHAATACPNAMLLIISNPVNSLTPIVAETMSKYGVYDPRKVVGVTTLDVCRARTFVGNKLGVSPQQVKANVIGGHAGTTILPILSQIPGINKLSSKELADLTKRIQFGGDEVVQAKAGKGSATLSMAYAASCFANSVLKGLNGEKDIVECTYVKNDLTDASFFATPCVFGKEGVEKILSYGKLSKLEEENFNEMMPTLIAQIKKGVEFANKSSSA